MANELPPHTNYKDYFRPDYTLHPQLSRDARYENKNTKRTLDLVKQKIFEQLRYLNGAPSVEMTEIPPDIGGIQGNWPPSICSTHVLIGLSRSMANLFFQRRSSKE